MNAVHSGVGKGTPTGQREQTAGRGRRYAWWWFGEVSKALEDAGLSGQSKGGRADLWFVLELTTTFMLVLLGPCLWALAGLGRYAGTFWTSSVLAVCLGWSCAALAGRFRSLSLLLFGICTLALAVGGIAGVLERIAVGRMLVTSGAAVVAGAGAIAVFRGLLGGAPSGPLPLDDDAKQLLRWSLAALWAVQGAFVVLLAELLGLGFLGRLGPVPFLAILTLSGTGLLCLRRSGGCAPGITAEAPWAMRGIRHGVVRAVVLLLVSRTFAAASSAVHARLWLESGLLTVATVAMLALFVSFYLVSLSMALVILKRGKS